MTSRNLPGVIRRLLAAQKIYVALAAVFMWAGLFAAFMPTNPATANQGSPVNGRIFYSQSSFSGGDIFSINPDGSDPANLTSNTVSFFPSLSADGAKVTYMQVPDEGGPEDSQIVVSDSDGSGAETIAAGFYPNLSPDGSKVLYLNVGEEESAWQVFDIAANENIDLGIPLLNLTSPGSEADPFDMALINVQTPQWADNDSLLFVQLEDEESGLEFHIFAVHLQDINNPIQITEENSLLPALDLNLEEQIATMYYAGAEFDEQEENFNIYLKSLDITNLGGIAEPVTLAQLSDPGSTRFPTQLTLSPDKAKILSVTQDFEDAGQTQEGIYLHTLSIDGSNAHTVIEDEVSFSNFTAAWSPDSQEVAFSKASFNEADELEGMDIFTADYNGSNLTNVTNNNFDEFRMSVISSPASWAAAEGSDGGNGSNDKNGDGIPDAEQPNVQSITNPVTGQVVVLELDEQCEIEDLSITTESANAVQDAGFNYPQGLVNFTADCGTIGYTTSVTKYYYNTHNQDFSIRKYNPNTHAYFTVGGSTIGSVLINGQSVLTASYEITDGGELDIDGVADGIIVDPIGLAQSVVGAPNTGLGGSAQ